MTQDTRNSPPCLKSPYGVGTWKVDTMGKAFRFIRLRSTGVNGGCVPLVLLLPLLFARTLVSCTPHASRLSWLVATVCV